MVDLTNTAKSKAKPKAVKKITQSASSSLLARLLEPSTWMGLLTIGTVFATGGAAAWLNPQTLPVLGAGIGLILTKEGR